MSLPSPLSVVIINKTCEATLKWNRRRAWVMQSTHKQRTNIYIFFWNKYFLENKTVHAFVITKVKMVLPGVKRNESWSFEYLEIFYFFVWVAMTKALYNYPLNHSYVLCISLYFVMFHDKRSALNLCKLGLVAWNTISSCSIICEHKNDNISNTLDRSETGTLKKPVKWLT